MEVKLKEVINLLIYKTFSLSFLNLLNFLITVFTISFILKSLGPLLWGKFILVQLWPNYLGILCLWSFTNNEVRQISLNRNSFVDINLIFNESLFIQIFLTIISILILICAKNLNLININQYGLIGIISIVAGHGTQFHWLLNGLEKIWQAAFFQLFSKIFIFILIVIFQNQGFDHNILLLFFGIGSLISNFFCLSYIFFKLGIKLNKISIKSIIKRFSKGILFFFSSLTANLKNLSTPLLLNYFGGEYYVGLFASLERIKSLLVQVSLPFTNSIFPRISYLNVNSTKSANEFKLIYFLILIAVCVPIVSIVFFYPELILLKFAGVEFIHLKLELQMISILSLLTVISEYFYYLNLISNNLRNKIFIYNSIGLIIVVCSGFFLIKLLNILGAIISLYLLELFNILIIFFKTKKKYDHF